MAQDTANTAQHTELAQRQTGAMWPRTPHTQDGTPSDHTDEKEPSDPKHRPHKTLHRAGTPVNRSQVAHSTAHTAQHTVRAHR